MVADADNFQIVAVRIRRALDQGVRPVEGAAIKIGDASNCHAAVKRIGRAGDDRTAMGTGVPDPANLRHR